MLQGRWLMLGAVAGLATVAGLLAQRHSAGSAPEQPEAATHPKATFAGGCFWCMEPPFEKLDGVIRVTSGYTGGQADDPSYKQVSTGKTGHTEAVQVVFDPEEVSYEQLLEVYWRNVDPTVTDRQFCDVGSQYRAAIFYHDDAQKQAAFASRKAAAERLQVAAEIVTPIEAASTFYRAEDYHQDYYRTHPVRYKFYRSRCGRDKRLRELWGTE